MKNKRSFKFIAAAAAAAVLMSVLIGEPTISGQGVTPYRFERINLHNFHSQGWKEQQVDLVQGQQQFSDESAHLNIVCGPDDDSDPRLIKGSVTMNLPTSDFPTLRRIRLRRGGYSGTYLYDLTELKYSTYLVQGAPTAMVLQIDVTGDEVKDFNIFFAPEIQGAGDQVVLDTWQQWDGLNGSWGIESATISGLPTMATIEEIVTLHPAARIIDTPPAGNNGEGVRFTVGPPALYPDNISYFDALIIGTSDKKRSTLFDFTCDSSDAARDNS